MRRAKPAVPLNLYEKSHLLAAFTQLIRRSSTHPEVFFFPAPKRALVKVFIGLHLTRLSKEKLVLRFIFIIAFHEI